ncbi:MAG TPA: hypothetical protein ENJ87_09070, partial [Gammaproteobacteria bacterium]|nr:hypothetical protein [Gammaproteobacteria bacterium]
MLTHGGTLYSVTAQADDKIIVGGQFGSYDGQANLKRFARLNANGSRDVAFNPVEFNGTVRSTTVQADNKILVGGQFTNYDGQVNLGRIA